MNFKRRVASVVLTGALIAGNINLSFADGIRVVTLGANLNKEQREVMLNFFGVKEDEVLLLEVNNQEEREYLEGIATEAQLGKKTFSCSYVEPTKEGSGINVKLANLSWLTPSMISSVLSTAGVTDANVIVAANFKVSGTGALTGILKGLEDAYGISLDEEKKEIASEELIITGNLGEDIGADKATGIINDIKIDIIKNNTRDTVQIAETINNITNNYNISLNSEQHKDIENLMTKISKQDYDYKAMKHTLNDIKKTINEKLESIGEGVDKGFFDTIKDWFVNIKDWFVSIFKSTDKDLGILESTNDSILGENAIIDATSEEAINTVQNNDKSEGLLSKIWNWFIGLFEKNDSENIDNTEDNLESSDITIQENTQLEEILIEEEHFNTTQDNEANEEISSNTSDTENTYDSNQPENNNPTEDNLELKNNNSPEDNSSLQ